MNDTFQQILKQHWGYDDFRGIQREIIESIAEGHDTLGLMPTGGGKSITFQVSALATSGMCLVVTPLIALMKDQVYHLRKRGIKAVAIYTGMTHSAIETALDNCILGNYKFLYVSPERLQSTLFLTKFKLMKVNLITVDESHCISGWGYDFRPTYLRIADVRKHHPKVPVLALTATATPQVIADIQDKLLFRADSRVVRMSFERPNLAYVVRTCTKKENELLHILDKVSGTAIVYANSRKRTAELAQLLNKSGISAAHYHAGLHREIKDSLQEEWYQEKFRVIVATNAFGMGIDKANVRLVIHADVPSSIEAYFQEAGRAGRDGEKAYAVLLTQSIDQSILKRRIQDAYPPKDKVRKIYEKLCYYFQIAMGFGAGQTFDFDMGHFCRTHRLYPTVVEGALHILSQAGYIAHEEDPNLASRLCFLVRRNELYDLAMPAELDRLAQLLMRLYSGLFSDFVFISEEQLANRLQLTRQEVYEQLLRLDKRSIINYVPRKQTPILSFVLDRVEAHKLHLPPAVYEDRLKQAKQHTDAVIEYIKSTHTCRSALLLNYFGEKRAKPCTHCDVCAAHHTKSTDTKVESLAETICTLLRNNRSYSPSELAALLVPQSTCRHTVSCQTDIKDSAEDIAENTAPFDTFPLFDSPPSDASSSSTTPFDAPSFNTFPSNTTPSNAASHSNQTTVQNPLQHFDLHYFDQTDLFFQAVDYLLNEHKIKLIQGKLQLA